MVHNHCLYSCTVKLWIPPLCNPFIWRCAITQPHHNLKYFPWCMMYYNQIAVLYSWDPMTIASQWNAHFLLNISFPFKLLDPVYGKGWSGEYEMGASCHYRTWIKFLCMPLHLWRLIKSHAIPVIENSEIDFGCKFTIRNPKAYLDSVCLFSFSSLYISNF